MKFETFDFKPTYKCDLMPELGTGIAPKIFNFTPPERTILGGGLIIEVESSSNEAWRGSFEWGHGRLSKVCACPQGNHLCVVANGLGYVVNTLDPRDFDILPINPITDVRAAIGSKVLLLVDFVSAYALGTEGVLWSKYLASDELKIVSIQNDKVHFNGWSAPENRYIELELNVLSGSEV